MPDDTRHPSGDAGGHNGTNGSRPSGMQSQPVAFGDLAEPVDLVAVQADDELINALAAGMTVSAPGTGGYDADDRVAAILAAWKADVDSDPIPELVDTDTAVSTVLAARQPSGRIRHLVPVAAAAAFVVLAIGGVSVTSYNAQPDDALWGVSKVLYSERAESVEAAARVEERIDNAKHALSEGQPVLAAQELAQAEQDLEVVRPQEGQDELAEAQDFLRAKAAETPEGQKVNPASPLATQPSRRVPESVRESQPSESEESSTTTREPDPSSATSEGNSGPEVASTPEDSTGRPTTRPTDDPRRAVAPESTASTSRPTPAPGTGTGEGKPDEPTGGSSPSATPEGRPDPTTTPVPPSPQGDEGDGEAPATSGPSASGDEAPATGN